MAIIVFGGGFWLAGHKAIDRKRGFGVYYLDMKDSARQVVFPAMLAAILIAAKLVLGFVPYNVEIVTLLIVVFSSCLPLKTTLPAVLTFCLGEMMLAGMGYWVITYFVYWPLLCLAAYPLRLLKKDWLRNLFAIVIAAFCTLLFGVISSALDAIFYSEGLSYFAAFAAIYVRGISFYVTQILSACISVGLLFTPLSLALKQVYKQEFLPRKKAAQQTEKLQKHQN